MPVCPAWHYRHGDKYIEKIYQFLYRKIRKKSKKKSIEEKRSLIKKKTWSWQWPPIKMVIKHDDFYLANSSNIISRDGHPDLRKLRTEPITGGVAGKSQTVQWLNFNRTVVSHMLFWIKKNFFRKNHLYGIGYTEN